MKRTLSILILSGIAVAANAQTFNTVSFSNNVGATANFIALGNSYTALLNGFLLTANLPVGDVAWVYDFNSNPAPAYSAVSIEIGGILGAGGTLDIVGNEKVFDMSGAPLEVANGLIEATYTNTGTSAMNFVYTNTFVFSQPATIGQAQKDILNILMGGNTFAQIDYIKQEFTPVPEPASLAILGMGAAALLRRRRS